MDSVEAYTSRLEYFRKRGNQAVMTYCLNRALWIVYNTVADFKSAGGISLEDCQRFEHKLKNTMRITLLRYYRMVPPKEYERYYWFAFPTIMRFSQKAKRVLRIIKKRLSKH